jgi:predicted permease
MESLLQDLRYGVRSLGRNWGFTALVVLTLALGIGANSVVFSAVNGAVLNPFPFPEPDRIVGVGTAYPRVSEDLGFFENLSPAEFEDVRSQSRLLEDVVAWDMGFRQIDTDGPPASTFSAFWWGDALGTLEMDAHLGRGFTDQEVEQNAAVAMLSHRFWQTHFGGDSTLVGNAISVNGVPHTLVGIIPEGVLIYGTDLWTVMPFAPSAWPRNRRQVQILARTAPAASLEAVNTELEGIARRVEAEYSGAFAEYADWRMEAWTWTDVNVSTLRTAAAILLAAVGFLLLLVCANVANMLLARATGRRQEMAVRTAMGAGRRRLVLQLLTESAVLAGVGGVAGLALAWVGTGAAQRYLDTMGVPVPGQIGMSGNVLLYTVGISVLAGLVFGVVPAVQAAREGVRGVLAGESRGATGTASRQRLLRTFVGLEVGVALVLLVAGGILVRSLLSLGSVDPGWDAEQVLTMRVTLPPERYSPEEIEAFYPALLERMEAIPGVARAASATQFPGRIFMRDRFAVEGRAVEDSDRLPSAFTTLVSQGYFSALDLAVIQGRVPDPATDSPDDPPVAVMNESAARAYFGGENPVGQRIRLGGDGENAPWITIVGVVADTRNRGLDQAPAPEFFASQEQLGGPNQFFFLIRTEGQDPMALLPAVREAVSTLDPEQPVYATQSAADVYADQSAPRRATAALLGVFAFFALTLAAAGIYGVVSYSVSARVREIGVRLALGADASGVRQMVVRQALIPVVLGAVVGLAVSFATSGFLQGMVHGVEAGDVVTRVAVAGMLLAVAAAASWVPALRASRLDPAVTLREE